MIRRIVVAPVVLAAFGFLSIGVALPAGAAPAPAVKAAASGKPWFCVAVAEINFGYCQYDPLG